MADTLQRALSSILSQLDNQYEVLVVDDGSTDNSVDIIERMQKQYANLRLLKLDRDKHRQLGETRNISVREAHGEYVILHVDADDVWDPYIIDFVKLFHILEKCIGRDVLVSGQQINIGKKNFLLQHGPYRNTHRAQDRDMWHRLAAIDSYIPVDHEVFRTRLSRPIKTNIYRILRNTWYQMLYDLRQRNRTWAYIIGCFTSFFRKNQKISFKTKILRSLLIFPVFIRSRFIEPLYMPKNMRTHSEFVAYREKNRGTFPELFTRFGCNPDLSFINSPKAKRIFLEGVSS